MLGMRSLRKLLSPRKRIDDVGMEELKREKIRLEQEDHRLQRDLEALEARKEELFLSGKDQACPRGRLALARRIREIDCRAGAKGRQEAFLHRHLRILEGLIQIKENAAMLEDLKSCSVLSRLEAEELGRYAERASVEGRFEMERFADLLHGMEAAAGEDRGQEEEAAVQEIVEAMERARAAQEKGSEEGVVRAVEEMNEALEKGRKAPCEA